MNSDESIVEVLERLKLGEEEAVREIWDRCYPRVLSLARKRLSTSRNRIADEEDIALSAIKSFCRAAQQGRFPDLQDQTGLWRVLLKITSRKAIDLQRYERRRPTVDASIMLEGEVSTDGLASVPAKVSEEQFAQRLIEEVEQRLVGLDDDLAQLALAKLEGYTNREIAEKFNIALRTVERRLNLVRRKWSEKE